MTRKNPLTYSFGISLVLHMGMVAAISLWMTTLNPLDLSVKSYIELTSEKPPAEKIAAQPKQEKAAPRTIAPPRIIEKGPEAPVSTSPEPSSVPAPIEDLEKILPPLPERLKVERGTPFAFIAPSPTRTEKATEVGFGPSEIKAFGQPVAGEDSSQGGKAKETRGSEAGAGVLSAGGDLAVIPGGGTQGGGGGTAERGLGMSQQGLSTLTPGGGGLPGSSEATSSNGAFSPARPMGIRKVMPSYPRSARLAGIEGVSLLKVEVLADGSVGRIVLQASSGNQELDRAAQAAVSQWHFAPARRGDRRIKAWVVVPIRFRLTGG